MKRGIQVFAFIIVLIANQSNSFSQNTILITYYSKTGNTEAMAEAVSMGATSIEGINVVLKPVETTTREDILKADAIILGSPVYNANVAPQIQEFITSWPFEGAPLKDKIGAVFVTAGGISAGEEITMMNMLQSMLIYGMIIVGGNDWKSPFGASAIVNEAPFNNSERIDPRFLKKAEDLGRRVAELLIKMKN